MRDVTYAGERLIHDADSHVMETPEWFIPFADPAIRDRLDPLFVGTVKPGEEHFIEILRRKHTEDEEFRSTAAEELMQRKNWHATG